jgi:hypothetical protein
VVVLVSGCWYQGGKEKLAVAACCLQRTRRPGLGLYPPDSHPNQIYHHVLIPQFLKRKGIRKVTQPLWCAPLAEEPPNYVAMIFLSVGTPRYD